MNEPRLCGRVLTQLFRNGQTSETTDIMSLARSCDADVLSVLRAMAALERAGLADARRLRLTLSGLALAAAFSGPACAGPALSLPGSKLRPRRQRRPGRTSSAASRPRAPLPRPSVGRSKHAA
jgi:hypothetical protein